MSDEKVTEALASLGIDLDLSEAKELQRRLGRSPKIMEAMVWGILNAERTSMKTLRPYLGNLPSGDAKVLVGPGEDAGIVEFAKDGKTRYGVAMSLGSHNHPVHRLPFEGAASAVEGDARDVACMGARLIGNAVWTGFGDSPKERSMAARALEGISRASARLGFPLLQAELRFGEKFEGASFLNVMSLGVIRADRVVHSSVPRDAAKKEYELILVGRRTDALGVGGAVFATHPHKGGVERGAQQIPNPLLMRYLLEATEEAFGRLGEGVAKIACKDVGGGGIAEAAFELVASVGLGVELDLDRVPVAMKGLPSFVIACSETQERFLWAVPPSLTPWVLEHFNRRWELGASCEGAVAAVIGKVVREPSLILLGGGATVCSLPVAPRMSRTKEFSGKLEVMEPESPPPSIVEPAVRGKSGESLDSMGRLFEQLLGTADGSSRDSFLEGCDTTVGGDFSKGVDEADAAVLAPLMGERGVGPKARRVGLSVALSGCALGGQAPTDVQASLAVVEVVRRLVATGATPLAVVNGLNGGDPQKPGAVAGFAKAIQGLAQACEGLGVPVVGGNTSLYNRAFGVAVGGVGWMPDFERGVVGRFRVAGSHLYLLGQRRREDLIGGLLLDHLGLKGAGRPMPDIVGAKKEVAAVLGAAGKGWVLSCGVVRRGGLALALARMAMPHAGAGGFGVKVDIAEAGPRDLMPYEKAFAETGGFVVEVEPSNEESFRALCRSKGVSPAYLGLVTSDLTFEMLHAGRVFIVQFQKALAEAWGRGLSQALAGGIINS